MALFKAELSQIARVHCDDLDPLASIDEAVQRAVSMFQSSGGWLLLVDDVAYPTEVLNLLMSGCNDGPAAVVESSQGQETRAVHGVGMNTACCVLMTMQKFAKDDRILFTDTLQSLSTDDCLEIMQGMRGPRKTAIMAEMFDIKYFDMNKYVSEILGNHPMTVVKVAKMLCGKSVPDATEILHTFKRLKMDESDEKMPSDDRHLRGMGGTVTINLSRIASEHTEKQAELARALLCCLSVMPSQRIEAELITDQYGFFEEYEHSQGYGLPYASDIFTVSQFTSVIELLLQAGLVGRQRISFCNGNSYEVAVLKIYVYY